MLPDTQLYALSLPYHWLKDFFLAAASLHLVLVEDALSYYNNLSLVGFGASSYITAQLALVNYHKKGIYALVYVVWGGNRRSWVLVLVVCRF